MRRRGPALVLLLALAASAGCRVGTTPEREAGRVRGVRDRFFEAIAGLDTGRLRYNTTADYVLVEDGAVWNLDSLFHAVLDMQRAGLRITYAFDDLAMRIEPPAAWITYRNRGILSGPRGVDTVHWVESAVLRYERGRWRIALLHSTRVRP